MNLLTLQAAQPCIVRRVRVRRPRPPLVFRNLSLLCYAEALKRDECEPEDDEIKTIASWRRRKVFFFFFTPKAP